MNGNISNITQQRASTGSSSSQLTLQQKAKVEINTTWMIPDSQCWIQVGEEDALTEVMFVQAKIKSKPSLSSDHRSSTSNQQCEVDLKDVSNPKYYSVNRLRVDYVHQVNLEMEEGYNDMVEMDHLNEAEILINLHKRYDQDLIYTFIGPTLVVMNPYKQIPALFTKEVIGNFSSQAKHQGHIDYKKNQPHTFAVAAQAYCKLFEREKNQAIVISGESGAGKTENAKTCMCFLTGLSGQDSSRRGSQVNGQGVNKSNKDNNIEDRILGCNPILEAFGNAKTVRNDNSSRFGKFVQIQVGKSTRKIKGAIISNYLLEKSRVTTPGNGERNYHIFYHLLYSGQKQLLDNLQLINQFAQPEQLTYLRGSNCYSVPTIDDKALFNEVVEAFHTMGITQTEQDTIFRIISSILLLGNVNFDGSTLTDTNPCVVKEEALLHTISTLLKVDYQSFLKTINTVTRKIGSSIIYSPKKLDEVISSRDSIARNMYDRMFTWIVTRLNSAINLNSSNGAAAANSKSDKEIKLCIGLLDIFGFEVFAENSFEQFCINFTNEKLQQLYIQYVFKSEEDEFIKEGLSNYVNQLGYKDNQNIIHVLDNPIGIFQLIDESSALGSSDDKKLFESIQKQHNGKPEIRFSNKGGKKIFTIIHTAKPVDYSIEGFREKNKAEVSQELSLTIAQSNDPILSSIFLGLQDTSQSKEDKVAIVNSLATNTKNTKENKFLGCKFRAQMKQLMDELIQADCHFIRCIKPNELKRPNYFLQGFVLIQIKYLGVLQAILSRKEGFPYRKDFKVFFQQFSGMVEKYRVLNLEKVESQKLDLKTISTDILSSLFSKDVVSRVLVGKTKIFAKDDFGKALDELLYKWYEQKKNLIKKIIAQFEVYTFKKNLKKNMIFIKRAIYIFQKIQATFKMKKQRSKYLNMKKSTHLVFKLFCKNVQKQFLKQWNVKTKQLIIFQKQKAKEQEELEATQKGKDYHQSENSANLNDTQNVGNNNNNHSFANHQTLERNNNNYSTNLSAEYATISNYNTFNAQNKTNNFQEIKDNYKEQSDNYQSKLREEDDNEKQKQLYEQIQNQNREIIESNLDAEPEPKKKLKSKVEYFLNLDNPQPKRPPPPEKSKDCLIDFNECNQEAIKKIENNGYFEIICQLIAKRKDNQTITERMSYEKKPISKPLTCIDKPNEPAALKAFTYMLKYAGDRNFEEEHNRIIAWKLLQLILDQDEQDVTDEITLQVIKQLTNNNNSNIEEYFKLAALISSCSIMSPRIVYPVMNFFYEQAKHYEKKEPRLMEWCKYILSRIGNSYNFDENNQLSYFIFKREEMPLKDEFIAIENMNSVAVPIYIYGDRCKYYKVESYIKVCNLVNLIGMDIEVISSNNWYGLVEYLTIDGVTQTQILDFGMRILDWRARKQRERQKFLTQNPSKTYEIKLYYQFIILHSLISQDIDTNMMLYQTYANEFLYSLYYFDISKTSSLKQGGQQQQQLQDQKKQNQDLTEIDFIVDLAAAKVLSDYKVYQKDNIKLNQTIPMQKLSLLKPEVWRVKIEDQVDKLLPTLKTQRKARSYFLNKMKFYQGKYFFSQKFNCRYSKSSNINRNDYSDEMQVVCLIKLGYIYIIHVSPHKELESISYREIRDFSINYSTQVLYIHTSQFSYQLVSQFSLNIYYNISQYCNLIEEIESNKRYGLNDQIFDHDSNQVQPEDEDNNSDDNHNNTYQQHRQDTSNTDNKQTNENLQSESRFGDYDSSHKKMVNQKRNSQNSPQSYDNLQNNNPLDIPDYSGQKKRISYDQSETSPNSQFSSGQNKLLGQFRNQDQRYLDESKNNLNKQFQNQDVDNSNIDQTNRSCNLYENLI